MLKTVNFKCNGQKVKNKHRFYDKPQTVKTECEVFNRT